MFAISCDDQDEDVVVKMSNKQGVWREVQLIYTYNI